MKTFHSFGTASGTLEMMCTWKITMIATATNDTVPPCVKSMTNGTAISTTVPLCAKRNANLLGRRSLTGSRYIARLNHLGRKGALLFMVATTYGKTWVSFEIPAPTQTATRASLRPIIIWS